MSIPPGTGAHKKWWYIYSIMLPECCSTIGNLPFSRYMPLFNPKTTALSGEGIADLLSSEPPSGVYEVPGLW